jgi:hypothetical protein
MADPATLTAAASLIGAGATAYSASQAGKGIKKPKIAPPVVDDEQKRLAAMRRKQSMADRGRAGTVLTGGNENLG